MIKKTKSRAKKSSSKDLKFLSIPIALLFIVLGYSRLHQQRSPHSTENSDLPQTQPSKDSQKEDPHALNTPFILKRPVECTSPYHNSRIGIRQNEGRGIGYRRGYTTLEYFGLSSHFGLRFLPFLDLRGHLFNNNRYAGNVGIGTRSLLSAIDHFLGIYLYYDVRNERHLTVHQISPGIELLGKRMEYRFNAYFPLGKDQSNAYNFRFDRFYKNHLFIQKTRKNALTAADGEIGVHFTQSSRYVLFGGLGSYYLTGPHAESWGGKARLLGRYKEYISLEATYSYDHLFKGIVQGSIGITLPFGRTLKRGRGGHSDHTHCALLLTRAVQSPSRFEIPIIKKERKKELAINPATGEPWFFWFVNNTSSSNGTFESPFPTLLLAQDASGPNDVIYAFPGTGSSLGMDAGITLQAGQKLFGSGIKQTINVGKRLITIPALSDSLPLMTNLTGSPVVSLDDGNELSGLNLQTAQSGSTLIFGGSNITDTWIHNNLLSGTVPHIGMDLTGSGQFIITNNQLQGQHGTDMDGIDVTLNDLGSLSGTISNNTIDNYNDGINFSPGLNAIAYFTITNNLVTNSGANGISWGEGGSINSQGSILNNIVANSGQSGIIAVAASSRAPNSGCVTISDNSVSLSSANGIFVAVFGPGGYLNASVTNNRVSQNTPVGISAETLGGSATLCLRLLNNVSDTGLTLTNGTGNSLLLEPLNNNQGGGPINITDVTLIPPNTCCPQ
jgi:hypothetical protein